MNDKLRDALAERLQDAFKATDGVVNLVDCRYVASRLLESVPGEEELAKMLFTDHWRGFGKSPSWDSPLLGEEREEWRKEARFLRSKIGWWVG